VVGRNYDEDTAPKLGRRHDRLGRLAEAHGVGKDHPRQGWVAIAELVEHMAHATALGGGELQAGDVLCSEREQAAFGMVQRLRHGKRRRNSLGASNLY